MTTALFILKYFSWLLTVGIPFIGTWFFDFTKTDKETGKKTLTPVGARLVYLAGLALLSALCVSVWSDHEAVKKERAAAESAEIERHRASDFQASRVTAQRDLAVRQADIKEMMVTLQANLKSLPPDQQEQVRQVVRKLSSVEDYKDQYPDLFKKMTDAQSFAEVWAAMAEGTFRKVAEHVNATDPKCTDMRINRFQPGLPEGFPGAYFTITDPRAEMGETVTFFYMIDQEGVGLELSITSGTTTNWFDKGYSILFADGSKSPVVTCEASTIKSSCDNHTGKGGDFVSLYRKIQSKVIDKVIVGDKEYAFQSPEREIFQKTMSCVAP